MTTAVHTYYCSVEVKRYESTIVYYIEAVIFPAYSAFYIVYLVNIEYKFSFKY